MYIRKRKLCTKRKLLFFATTLSVLSIIFSIFFDFSLSGFLARLFSWHAALQSNYLRHIKVETKDLGVKHGIFIDVSIHENTEISMKPQPKVPVHNRILPGYFVTEVENVTNQNGIQETRKMIVPKIYQYENATQAFKKYVSYLQLTEKLLPNQSRAVIIVTNYRSGSSFFGELLNQHPDIFYIFEPLIPVTKLEKCNVNDEIKKMVLSDLFQCRMPDWLKIYLGIPSTERPKMSRNIFTCLRKKFCFVPFTKELITQKHCLRTNLTTHHDSWDHCGAVNLNLASNECRRKKMVAIKVIRLCDIGILEDVIAKSGTDVKVVHLIRDPRGIASSRHALHRKLKLREALRFTCKRQSDNSDLGLYVKPKWLENRYKLFRYEDAALRPYEIAQQLYDYLGLDFPLIVKRWIRDNTQQAPPEHMRSLTLNDDDVAEIYPHQRTLNKSPWGHSRNSTHVVQKWRARLPFMQVKVIESVCGDIMRKAGYLPVQSSEHYANISAPLFKDRLP